MVQTESKKRYLLVICIIVIAVAICYHHTLNYPFLNWDDYKLIRDNPYNKSLAWDNLTHLLNPFVTGSVKVMRDLSYAVDFQLWGGTPRSIRMGTLFLYISCCFLVFLLLKLLLRHGGAALFGALVFVVHPLHVESVTWLSARKEALSATFFLLAFLVYVYRARPGMPRRGRYYALALLLYVLAIFSKETAVVLPAMIVLYEAAFGDRTPKNLGVVRRSLPTIPFFAIAAGFTVLVIHISAWIHVLKTYHGGSAATNFLSVLVGPFTGMRMLFFPFNLSARYINVLYNEFWSVPVILALACLAGLIFVAIDNWRHSRIFSFAILWFFIALAPVSNLVPISTLVADRYLFMPSIAYCLLLAFIFHKVWIRRRRPQFAALLVLFLALPAVFAGITHQRNLIWKDNYSLWGSVVRQNPENVMGHMAFGNVAAEKQDWDLAIKEFQRALWLNWDLKEVHNWLGNVYLQKKDWDNAIFHFNFVVRDTTSDPGLHVVLGEYFHEKGDPGEAITHFRRALQLDTTNVSAQMGIVDAYARMGRLEVALLEYQSLVDRYSPAGTGHRIEQNIALAYFQQGKYEEAIEWYERAAAIDSTDARSWFGIARSYELSGSFERAEANYRRALEVNPSYAEAQVNLGTLAYRSGRFADALAWFTRAAAADSSNSDARNNAAMAHYALGDTARALSALHGIARDDSLFIPARVNLAAILIERGAPERAARHLRLVVGRNPDHTIAQFNLAFCYALLDSVEGAYRHFMDALTRGFADTVEVQSLLGLENIRTDPRFGEAWRQFSRAGDGTGVESGARADRPGGTGE